MKKDKIEARSSLAKKLPFLRRNKTNKEKFAEVMGDDGFSIWWLLPIYRLSKHETRVEAANFF